MDDRREDAPPTGLDLLLAEREINQVLLRYSRGNSRHDWEAVRAAFHPDAYYEHLVGKELPDQLIEHIKQGHATMGDSGMLFGTLIITNVLVDFVDASHACVESYNIGLQRIREGRGLTDKVLHSRFIDRFERREGGPWLIAHRVALYGARRFDPVDERAMMEEDKASASWRRSRIGPLDELYSTPGARWYSTESDSV